MPILPTIFMMVTAMARLSVNGFQHTKYWHGAGISYLPYLGAAVIEQYDQEFLVGGVPR
jgi:hypothetical protein